jgi:hypothetical protein
MQRGDWAVRSETETHVTTTKTDWKIRAHLRAWEGDTLIHEQAWDETIARDHV